MKKKVLIIISIAILLCGCSNLKKFDFEGLVKPITTPTKKYNTYRTGYKYYLPKGLNVEKTSLYNDVIESGKYKYYLYADVISYFNNIEIEYKENENAFYSKKIQSGKKYGYIEINLKENNQYLIEIMFNYAKIEVMVDYKDINLAVNYAVSILRSIKYNDNVIKNLLGDDILSYQEEVYNIFNTTSSDSSYLEFQEPEDYQEDTTTQDEDLVN